MGGTGGDEVMAKNKKKQKEPSQVIVSPLDYERLAKCIAKEIAEENDKRINSDSPTREWMKLLITPVFWGISIIMGLLAIAFFITAFTYLSVPSTNPPNYSSMTKGMFCAAIALFASGIAMFTYLARKELDKEMDRQFVAAVFSGMVSLAALIVALVALFRG